MEAKMIAAKVWYYLLKNRLEPPSSLQQVAQPVPILMHDGPWIGQGFYVSNITRPIVPLYLRHRCYWWLERFPGHRGWCVGILLKMWSNSQETSCELLPLLNTANQPVRYYSQHWSTVYHLFWQHDHRSQFPTQQNQIFWIILFGDNPQISNVLASFSAHWLTRWI